MDTISVARAGSPRNVYYHGYRNGVRGPLDPLQERFQRFPCELLD
jgi:hypothetical protein